MVERIEELTGDCCILGLFSIEDVKQLSQRLQAAEDINRIAAMDLKAAEAKCGELAETLRHVEDWDSMGDSVKDAHIDIWGGWPLQEPPSEG